MDYAIGQFADSTTGEIVFPGARGDTIAPIFVMDDKPARGAAFARHAFGIEVVDSKWPLVRLGPNERTSPLRAMYVGADARYSLSRFWDTVDDELRFADSGKTVNEKLHNAARAFGVEHLLLRRSETLSTGETLRAVMVAAVLAAPDALVIEGGFEAIDPYFRISLAKGWALLCPDSYLVLIENGTPSVSGQVWRLGHVVEPRVESRLSSGIPKSATLAIDVIPNQKNSKVGRHELDFRNVSVARGGHPVLVDVNIKVASGEVAFLYGPNGCGKSTLLEATLGWIEKAAGEIVLCAASGEREPLDCAYAPSLADESITELTLLGEVLLGRTPLGGSGSDREKLAERDELVSYGIHEKDIDADLADSTVLRKLAVSLSALTSRRRICLLDEPTLLLDSRSRRVLLRAISRFLNSGGIALIATHDTELKDDLLDAMHSPLETA
jgi:ABC-type cobalamin/Fe3+-siderophores transport system ATPase subunit